MASAFDLNGTHDPAATLSGEEAPIVKGTSDAVRISTPALRWATVFLGLLLVAILWQWLGRAYSSEFSGADESAHFVTGLMIRDYVASGFRATPMTFAKDYYAHYPKVAFGIWGPLLHITEAAWTLVFPPTRVSLLLLMAMISACTAFLLSRAVADEFGSVFGIMAGFLFLSVYVVQRYTGMIMADSLVALLDFCAALAFGRYLNGRRWKHAAWFGVFVSMSILTKGNGGALLLLPPFAILLGRRWNVLKEKSFWAAVAIIGCIAGPWEYYSLTSVFGIQARKPPGTFIAGYVWAVLTIFGIALLPVVAAGVYDRLIRPVRRGSPDGIWVSVAALVCSVWAFHAIVPVEGVNPRYLIAVMPPSLMFLIAGIRAIAGWTEFLPIRPQWRLWGVTGVVVVLFLIGNFSIPQRRYFGFDEVAERLESPQFNESAILVSSDALDGEGMLISELAMREKRPSHIVLRATKMLSQSDWMGERYSLLYHSPEEVMTFLRETPVELVVIQSGDGPPESPDHKLLVQTIDRFAAEWEHLGTFPQRRGGELGSKIDAYRQRSAAGRRVGKIRILLPYTLRGVIEN